MLTKLESQLLQYTVILLFISLAAAFVGFRVGGYSVVPDPLFLSRYYRTATASDITKRITLGMILAIGKNAKINQKRQIIISVSQISFIIAMITAVIFLVDQVGRFVG
jgi:uncharacterized membrane protein